MRFIEFSKKVVKFTVHCVNTIRINSYVDKLLEASSSELQLYKLFCC